MYSEAEWLRILTEFNSPEGKARRERNARDLAAVQAGTATFEEWSRGVYVPKSKRHLLYSWYFSYLCAHSAAEQAEDEHDTRSE